MTANTTSSEQSLQDYLDQGLRGMWYPVLASWEVGNNPVGITRLEQQIVVWRDGEGQIHALEDRCPHRGARLSMGWNLGDRIACWYHGVEVGGDGTVKDVPAVDRCPLVGQKCLRSYPAKEAYGAVFLYFGVTADEAPAELTFPQELADEASYSNFLCTASWNCNYQYALENVMDPMHGTYLHSSSHSMAEGDRKADMGLEPTDSGFIFKKNGQIGVNFDWVGSATAARIGCACRSRTKSASGRAVTSGSSAWWCRKTRIIAGCSSGASVRSKTGSATCGASCTATAWNRCIGMCSSRIASCLKIWRLTPAAANTCTSTTSAFRACAA